MIGRHGMKVPSKVVALTYRAIRTGSVKMPNQPASRTKWPF